MTEIVIDVSVPQSVDILAVANTVDISPDPQGATVVLIAAPGPPGPRGAPGDNAGIYGESPTGTRDGVNTVFTLSSSPATGSTAVYRNGLRELLGSGYMVSGAVITFSAPPLADDVLTVDYLIGS